MESRFIFKLTLVVFGFLVVLLLNFMGGKLVNYSLLYFLNNRVNIYIVIGRNL